MSNVQSETHGAVRVIRLARPEKKNALTVAMYEAVNTEMAAAAADDAVSVLVITGAPGVFTAGNDLGDFLSNPPSGEDSAVFRLLLGLVDFPKPLIAAVDGPAVGVGTTMLLHCDFVVATTRARMQMPFVALGLVPEGGSSLLLPQLAGLQRATEWLLLGTPIDAATAASVGLVNRVVAPEDLESTMLELATLVASRPAAAVRAAKDLIRAPQREALKQALAREGASFIERLASPEAAAAMMAFFARK